MSGRFVLALALGATVLAPLVAPTYHVLLMLPFMAYAVALLGLNLLFGYTGLVSFGHALFLDENRASADKRADGLGVRDVLRFPLRQRLR